MSIPILQSIYIVVSGDFGSRLLFCYPPPFDNERTSSTSSLNSSFIGHSPPYRNQFTIRTLASLSLASPSNPSSTSKFSPHSNHGSSELHETVAGIPVEEFTRLFSLPSVLHGQPIEIQIGHALIIAVSRKTDGTEDTVLPRNKLHGNALSTRVINNSELTSFTVVFIIDSRAKVQRRGARDESSSPSTPFSDPTTNETSDKFSQNQTVSSILSENLDDFDLFPGSRALPSLPTSIFFANPKYTVDWKDTRIIHRSYGRIADHFSRALAHEQKRCGFLSQQTTILQAARDKFLRVSNLASTSLPEELQSGASSVLVMFVEYSLKQSLLAQHIADLYEGLIACERGSYTHSYPYYTRYPSSHAHTPNHSFPTNDSTADVNIDEHALLPKTHFHIRINRWIHLHCTLSPHVVNLRFPFRVAHQPTLSTTHSVGFAEKITGTSLRPYHSLLLTTPMDELLQSLPPDCSPILTHFVRIVDPTQSFLAMSSKHALPLPQLLLLAAHLVHWGQARLIRAISADSIYLINPEWREVGNIDDLTDKTKEMSLHVSKYRRHDHNHSAAVAIYPPKTITPYMSVALQELFISKFPNSALSVFLSLFSLPIPFSKHVQRLSSNAKTDFLAQLLFCLQRGMIQQLYTYVYYIGEPVEIAPKTTTSNLWRRLVPYFEGSTNLEEIVWKEAKSGLTMPKLLSLLSQHSEEIISVLHT